jgi:apolipoprotein N-acyltransferase
MQMAALDVRPDQRLAGTVFSQVRYWPLLIVLAAGLLVSLAVSRRGRKRRTS